jgi:hypothetical protein
MSPISHVAARSLEGSDTLQKVMYNMLLLLLLELLVLVLLLLLHMKSQCLS